MVCLLRWVPAYKEEEPGTGREDWLRDTLTVVKSSLPGVCIPFYDAYRTSLVSPLLNQGCDRQAAGVCLSGTHQKNQVCLYQPLLTPLGRLST